MAYVAVNPLLYNAALAGFLSGMFSGQNPNDTSSSDYANAVSQGVAFAQALDTAIPADAAITTGGVAIAPTTGPIQEKEVGKSSIIFGLSFAVAANHYNGPLGGSFTPTDFTTGAGAALVAGVKAIYNECAGGLLTP